MNDNHQIDEVDQFMRDLNISSGLLTDVEVAKILRCNVQTLRNDRWLGRGIKYLKIGGRVKYRGRDVAENLLREQIYPRS